MTSLYGGIGIYTHWVADDFSDAIQYSSTKRPAPNNSALTKIKEHRECKKKEVFAAVQTNSAHMSPAECG